MILSQLRMGARQAKNAPLIIIIIIIITIIVMLCHVIFKSHINISSPGPGSVLDSCYGGGAPIMILFKISRWPQFHNFVVGARELRLSNLTCFQKQVGTEEPD